jgi:hypothetical protein
MLPIEGGADQVRIAEPGVDRPFASLGGEGSFADEAEASACIENGIARSLRFDGPAEVISHRVQESRPIDRCDDVVRRRPDQYDTTSARHRELGDEV